MAEVKWQARRITDGVMVDVTADTSGMPLSAPTPNELESGLGSPITTTLQVQPLDTSEDPGLQIVVQDGQTSRIMQAIQNFGSTLQLFAIGAKGNVSHTSVHETEPAFHLEQWETLEAGEYIMRVDSASQQAAFGLDTDGRPAIKVNAAPADADVRTSQLVLWFDDTDGAGKLMIKAKTANGTVVTGSVNLT